MSDLLHDSILWLVVLLSALGIAQALLLIALVITIKHVRRQIRALYRTRRAWEFSMEQTTTYFQAVDLLKRTRAEKDGTPGPSSPRQANQRLRLG